MRLDITRKSHLAIRVLTELRAAGGMVSGSDLADRVETSTAFLAQVVRPLTQLGWVASQPGRSCGYELVVDAEDISVLDVIEAVEGPTDTESCVLRSGQCSVGDPCATHDAWSRARSALIKELSAIPLTSIPAERALR